MKKYVIIAAVIMLAACSRNLRETEAPEQTPDTYTFTLSASIDQELTKSDYNASGEFSWSEGDKISVLFHNDGGDPVNKFFTLTATSIDGKNATFSGPVTSGYTEGSNSGAKWALFPASDNHVYNTDNVEVPGEKWITFHIPSYTDFTADGAHWSANIPMAANTVTDGKYIFENMGGAYKFTFTDLNVGKVTFTVYNAVRAISGNIPAAEDGAVKLHQSSTASAEEQTLSFTANVVGKTASFYIPYRVWTNDFQPMLVLKDTQTDYPLYTKTAVTAFTGSLGMGSGAKLVVVPSISVPGTPPAPAPEPTFDGLTHIAFTETSTDILNPERGFYKQHSNIIASAGTDALSVSKAESYRVLGYSLVYLGFYLDSFMEPAGMETTAPISDAFIEKIQNSLAALRSAGLKCILRFAYKNGHGGGDAPYDPVKSVLLGHITQLTPTLQAYKDVIFVLQCGFIGSWGEWYYTTNFPKENPTDRKAVVDALLSGLPTERQVQMRTPGYTMGLYNLSVSDTLTASTAHNELLAHARLAGHNDCFGASSTDSGTFGNQPFDRFFWQGDTRYTIMGGETCGLSEFCTCINTQADLEAYHWTYLNSGYHEGVVQRWKDNDCYDTIAKRLGYRLVLTDVYHTATPEEGQPFSVTLKLRNDGYAAPQNPRDAKLVFVPKTGSNTVIDLGSDPRTWHPGTHYIQKTFNLPSADGTLYLWLPDPLLDEDPRYSIGICSKQGDDDIYNPATGYNKILTVGNPVAAPAIVIDGDFDDWASVTPVYSGINDRIVEWKANSDALNVYFYYKMTAEKIKSDGSSSFYIGFNLDNDASSGSQGEHGAAGNNAGLEALAYFYPWMGTTEVKSGEEATSWVQRPVGTSTGSKVTVDGKIQGGYAYLEISIPRSSLGSPVSGSSFTVKTAVQYYPTTSQVITLN